MATGSACREPGAVHCVGNATTRTNGNRRRTGCPTIAAPAIFPIPQRHCVAERSSCCCSACCKREKERGMFKCLHYQVNASWGWASQLWKKVLYVRYTHSISSSNNPLKACSSMQVIWLLSSCRLRNDCAPLKTRRPTVVMTLCEISLQRFTGRQTERVGRQADSRQQAGSWRGDGEEKEIMVNKCVQFVFRVRM